MCVACTNEIPLQPLVSSMKELICGLRMIVLTLLLTGCVYPALVTLCAQGLFPWQANGSLLQLDGKNVGSQWIAQPFSQPDHFPEYLHPRPSAPATQKYQAHPKMPGDLLTASASGLDPHLSPLAVRWQATRIAEARNIDIADLEQLIDRHTEQRTFGILGERRVNVLKLNLALNLALNQE